MALFPYCRLPSGFSFGNRKPLIVLGVCLLAGLIYFLKEKRMFAVPNNAIHVFSEVEQIRSGSYSKEVPVMTPWGSPLVWGDSESSAWRRNKVAHLGARTGLAILAIGNYNHYIRRLLSSADLYFLLNFYVTYYVLTDRPTELDPPLNLWLNRELRVIPVAEMPGWDRLGLRRMALLATLIKEQISLEVDYVFCIDADQEFTNPVGTEILGKLTATLHPLFYGKPRYTYPYERNSDSLAYVALGEGDYYYSSEFYGGLCSKVLAMVQTCSLLILQDQEKKVRAQELEESYLNRYLINNRPTCVLSPEYSWWDSPGVPGVPTQRLCSIGRQCLSTGNYKGNPKAC
ncbi:globoside alpha-1,3-N-acetylgalactosaminyltransferase 1-like [Tachysurus fulvidraco]|uniref:globoside alpha-1,3-N-acetylgalactosaminyltransferase 1-like n=1 Tax=Tachysurus fulvidraco TaxID=1234273 RepID=UPI001FEE9166|nr:globoside alpha-1,3-N-acetylgalactosaminyltransferase 1-like [Tachysurus fulvidraco]